MVRDIQPEHVTDLFDDTEMFSASFPDSVERVSAFLSRQENVEVLTERMRAFADQYQQDRGIMRFHNYNPARMLRAFETLEKPWMGFQSRSGFIVSENPVFITEDEVNAALSAGGPFEHSRLAMYAHWLTTDSRAEHAAFLRRHYGEGGRSHALSGADDSEEAYGIRGITLRRGKPEYSITWNQVAQRVDSLIREDLYLTAADHERMPSYERAIMAGRVEQFYRSIPRETPRAFHEDDHSRNEIVQMLSDTDSAVELLNAVTEAMSGLEEGSPTYERLANMLFEFFDYVDGSYTIFLEPQWKQALAQDQS